MLGSICRLIGLLILCVAATGAWAAQARRVALVMGNGAYKHTSPLTNPANDATDMAAALKRLGFDVVEGRDLDESGMRRTIKRFAELLTGADVGLFFYAGHGLQVGGYNYLVPVDARLDNAAGLDFELIRLDVVHRTMERETKTNVIFLDACRDNPLSRNLARSMGTRSSQIGKGLAVVESGVGTLISFSTQPGNTALDGEGHNSPFAGALIKHISNPREDLSTLLIQVRNEVMAATRDQQIPWEHSALRSKFYFAAVPPSEPATVAPARLSEAAEAWDRAKDATSIAVLEAFITRYKDTFYADLARARSDDLKRQQVTVAAPPRVLTPAPAKTAEPAVPAVAITPTPSSCGGVMALVGKDKRCLKPTDSFRDCGECPEMVVSQAGQFIVGSPADEKSRGDGEGPQRSVKISYPFAAGKFEVTFADWDACVAAGGCKHKSNDQGWGRGTRPVINVSWNDAKEYASWLAKRTDKPYRLLSEAEWEYAARAGTTTPYSTGWTISTDQANFDGRLDGQYDSKANRGKTIEVGLLKKPNAFGLHHMHGNVSEWVEDCFHDNYQDAPSDAAAWITADCGRRVIRGGSWASFRGALRSAARFGFSLGYRENHIGFRLARTLGP